MYGSKAGHRHTTPVPALAAALAMLMSAACAVTPEAAAPGTEPAPPPPGGEPAIVLSADAAAVGDEVRVTGHNFAPNSTVRIGFGPPQSEYEVIRTVRADAEGTATATVRVPDWAETGREYLWVVAAPGNDPRVISDPFRIEQEGAVRVEGRLTNEGVECLALRTDDNTLYTLTGDTGDFGPGDRVRVEGSVADASFCMQGTTIQVQNIERRR